MEIVRPRASYKPKAQQSGETMKYPSLIKYTPKKSWKGSISVPSYIVDKAIRQGKDLVIEFEGKTMTILNEKLKDRTQLHYKKLKNQYSGKEYEIYDFWFRSDEEKKNMLTLF